jgi:hypothetical protein
VTMDLLTKRQLACLASLPEDYRVIGLRRGSPIIERANGEILRIQPNGRLAVTTSVQQVRSYLEMERC